MFGIGQISVQNPYDLRPFADRRSDALGGV
jgi:hypothetical protein